MIRRLMIAALVVAGAAVLFAGSASAQAMAHLGHVMESWNDTPGKVGLITILEQEAKIANQHANYGKSNPATHMPHVRHALDASSESGGPGKGYGVLKAAMGVAAHMKFAAESPDATDSIKAHSVHIITSANNVVAWAKEAMGMSKDTSSASMSKVEEITGWILNGRDADGDGKISWEEGEGGLAQMKQHLGFIDHM
jgi:hypothetical protein